MPDVRCLTCGEPWDTDFVLHMMDGEFRPSPELRAHVQEDGWEFGSTAFCILHCEACKSFDLVQDTAMRAAVEMAESMFPEDPEGLAAELGELFLDAQ